MSDWWSKTDPIGEREKLRLKGLSQELQRVEARLAKLTEESRTSWAKRDVTWLRDAEKQLGDLRKRVAEIRREIAKVQK